VAAPSDSHTAESPRHPGPRDIAACLRETAYDAAARRGLTAADSEWKLICTTHNLLKLYRLA
jgi:hypothetical protein